MAVLSAPTLDELIQNVRNLLNQPNANNSTWTDEELATYLNEAIRRYFAEVVLHSEGQFTTQDDLDIVENAETVELPMDCFEVRAVYRKVSGGYQMLPYRNNLTESYSTSGGTGGETYLPYYYMRKNALVLRPVPNFSETDALRIEYIQFPETMVTAGDSLTTQVSPVFKDLVEAYAVYKAKLKESLVSGVNLYGAARENLNDLFTAFKESIGQRSHNPTAIIPFSPEDTP